MDSGRPCPEDEEFVDILEERRQNCDLGHAFRTFKPRPFGGALHCSAADLSTAVLESQYLRYITREIAMETGSSEEAVKEEAHGILQEMSHNLQLGFIRLLGFTLSKVFKRLFSSICINMEGVNRLQQAIQECPVILMPNHRSYVDFLVISYILFTYDIPVPVIAAGVPLAGMKMIGEILRRSGAFFIRRAIGTDKLYWAVLSEYVKTIVRRGFAPLEFYVEGLRSRTLKSLTPKLGMMHMVLEPYFKGEVYDIMLVPISISYDRVLEESLLAHELLGIPKPKESTMALLKANRVLQEGYGSMHVNFGHPLSVRQLSEGRIDRRQYNLVPRDLPQKPSVETQACVSWLASLVVHLQERGSVLSPWSIMACLLLQIPTATLIKEGLAWEQLIQRTIWLRKLALTFGARFNWPEHVPDSEVMSSSMALHRSVVLRKGGHVHLLEEEEPAGKQPISPEEGVARRAAAVLMVASYRNQALHVFVLPALLAVAMHVTKSTQRDELFTFFSFLQDIFSNELIFIPGCFTQDFEEACTMLEKCGAVQTSQQEVIETEMGLQTTSFLRALLQPFIDSYQVVFSHLCEDDIKVFSEKHFVRALHNLATRLILSGELHSYEALSSDTQKNVLSALLRLEAVTKLRFVEQNEYRVNKAAVRRLGDMLSGKIPPQMLTMAPDARL
ncbi:dihydroxyacetone phosphate acyltransferase [Lampris incognitus]|uniref:dihydroxyacetone phosphate acyltransferase n=1 Tax=Lampris incognitus TaxID=2546036 RepID=UPI0024B4D73B|nr:dihydroxyacetone phosphate acyltransferase [Lampris incognitus]